MSYELGSYIPRIEEDLRRLRNQMITAVLVCSIVAAALAATVVVWRNSGTDGEIDARIAQVREHVGKLESQLTALQSALDQQRGAGTQVDAPPPAQGPRR